MRIIFYDGSEMECAEVYFTENELIVDGYRVVPLITVQRIVTA